MLCLNTCYVIFLYISDKIYIYSQRKASGVCFGSELLFISILFSSVGNQVFALVPDLKTLAESGERGVIILGSLCLPCYMRETVEAFIHIHALFEHLLYYCY